MPTEKDKKLIAEAERLSCVDWEKAFHLARQADTEVARNRLENIGRLLYHKEEYEAGME